MSDFRGIQNKSAFADHNPKSTSLKVVQHQEISPRFLCADFLIIPDHPQQLELILAYLILVATFNFT
jgi:hypothetical protein